MLADIIDFNPKENLRKGTIAKKIAMEQLQPFTRKISAYEHSGYNGGTKFRNGDTLLARITPCLENGKTAKVTILDDGEIAFGSTEYIVLRAKPGISDPDFIYYLAISPAFRDIAIKSMVGTTGRQRVQQDVLEKAELSIPDLPTQKAIGQVLSCLDDKIELNTAINQNLPSWEDYYALEDEIQRLETENQNLEAQAKAIFKSWFIDFEPFKNGEFIDSESGRIPKGWRVEALADIADFLNGLAMQRFRPSGEELGLPVLKIKELRQGACDANSERCSSHIRPEYIVRDGDVVFSWSGSLMVDFWCGGNCGLNQHLFKVTSTNYAKWFYYSWLAFHLNEFVAIAADKATTMGHIKREHLASAQVLVPQKEAYTEINVLLSPICDNIVENRIFSRKLAGLRDNLLPKLMSGEIDVSEVAI